MKKKYRIKSHFRFGIFLTMLMILTITTTGTFLGLNDSDGMTKPTYTEIQIISGDTLWDLAKSYGPDDQDIRKVVYAICKVNNISAQEIHPGQHILVPEYL